MASHRDLATTTSKLTVKPLLCNVNDVNLAVMSISTALPHPTALHIQARHDRRPSPQIAHTMPCMLASSLTKANIAETGNSLVKHINTVCAFHHPTLSCCSLTPLHYPKPCQGVTTQKPGPPRLMVSTKYTSSLIHFYVTTLPSSSPLRRTFTVSKAM